jgi:hypothetical protein
VVLAAQAKIGFSAASSTTTTILPPPPPDSPDLPDNDPTLNYLVWSTAGTILAIISAGLTYYKLPKPVQRPLIDNVLTKS